MKFHLHINQPQAIELGVQNITQAHILDLLMSCSTWATPITIDDHVYYWVARQVICDEIPLLNIKPDTAWRHMKALHEIGLIDHTKAGKKDCVRVTELGKSYYVGNKSELDVNPEINPSKSGNKSENNSEINPTYPTTKLHPTTKINKRFVKPTLDEVQTYCNERKNNIDPEYFIDSNEAKGWLVGKTKTPMKDWKAVIRTWEKNDEKRSRSSKTGIDFNDTSWADELASEPF